MNFILFPRCCSSIDLGCLPACSTNIESMSVDELERVSRSQVQKKEMFAGKRSVVSVGVFSFTTFLVLVPFISSSWLGEIAGSFRLYYFFPLVALATCFLVKRNWLLMSLVVITSAINVMPLLYLFQREVQVGKGETLKVVQVNVEYCNQNRTKLVQWLKQVDPDVIAVEELSLTWDVALREEFPGYDAFTVPQDSYYGIGLFSKRKLMNGKSFIPPAVKPIEPAIFAKIPCKNGSLNLAAVHVFAPHRPDDWRRRNMQMNAIAEAIGANTSSTILLADLNSVPWSNEMMKFRKITNLRDSRLGFGIKNTCLVKHLLWVPIDHCLVSPGIRVQKMTIGPSFGSDHLPMLLELKL